MKFTLQDAVIFSGIPPNPGMQSIVPLCRFDTKTVTGRHVLEPLLRSIPRICSEPQVATSALGSALGGALALLSESGGQIIAFQSTLPMVGQGALLEHQAEEQLHGTDNENMLYRSRDNYWKELAEECVDHGVGVSLILFPNRYIDVATLGMYSEPKPAVLLIRSCRRPARDHGR